LIEENHKYLLCSDITILFYIGFEKNCGGFVDLMVWPWFERLKAFAQVFNMIDDITRARYPRLSAWGDRMSADPAVKATTYPKELFVKFLEGAAAGAANYDEGL